MNTKSAYRPEYLEALQLLAEAFDEVVRAGYSRPILVGGAAVEFYTGGAVTSGDFDVVTPVAKEELERTLIARGFERPSARGSLLRGLHHPQLGLCLGVECVLGELFDGAADTTRVRLVNIGNGTVAFPSIEDLIADRMGQFSSTDSDFEMLDQARVLFRVGASDLANNLDETYLDRRIREETLGAYDLNFLREQTK